MKKTNIKATNNDTTKNDYIKSLESTVNLLQHELKNLTQKMSASVDKQSSRSINNNPKHIDFNISECISTQEIIDKLHAIMVQYCSIVELDLFTIDKKQTQNIKEAGTSTTLLDIYNDFEERGLIEWALETREIRILQSFNSDNEAIKSIIIYPVTLLNKPTFILLANSTLPKEDLLNKNLSELSGFIEKVVYLTSYIDQSAKIEKIKLEQLLLRKQILRSSNKITASEIVLSISDDISVPLKIIKSNIELIKKGVGDISRRISILIEQFEILNNTQDFMKKFGTQIEFNTETHSFAELVDTAIHIILAKLNRNGITITKNINAKNVQIRCFETQIVFAILNILSHSIEAMPDGGKINISLHNNEENNKIILIITNAGLGLDTPEINGNLIDLSDFSSSKIESRYLFMLSQHILVEHRGKFSVFSEIGKGTTYKITLPVV